MSTQSIDRPPYSCGNDSCLHETFYDVPINPAIMSRVVAGDYLTVEVKATVVADAVGPKNGDQAHAGFR